MRRRVRAVERFRPSALGMFVLVLVGSVVLTIALRAVQTVAQDGLPTPEGPPTPIGRLGGAISIGTEPVPGAPRTPTATVRRQDIPDQASCDVEPRTIDEILKLVPTATPAASTSAAANGPAPSGSSPAPTPSTTPSDRPATAAIVGQVQRTVREMTACGNAGDLLSLWAFFSDAYVSGAAAQQGVLFNRTILTARVRAQTARQDAMPTVSDVRSRGDGSVTAQVTVPLGSPFSVITGQTGVVTCEFILVDGRWQIDRVFSGDGTGGP